MKNKGKFCKIIFGNFFDHFSSMIIIFFYSANFLLTFFWFSLINFIQQISQWSFWSILINFVQQVSQCSFWLILFSKVFCKAFYDQVYTANSLSKFFLSLWLILFRKFSKNVIQQKIFKALFGFFALFYSANSPNNFFLPLSFFQSSLFSKLSF